MKLLCCFHCGDIFNLQMHLKSCSCGKTKGMYKNNRDAVVNGEGVSIGMGTGSFNNAIFAVVRGEVQSDFRESGDVWRRHESSIICWARPHSGPANSNTTVDPTLGDSK
jgi:hypothetical protein